MTGFLIVLAIIAILVIIILVQRSRSKSAAKKAEEEAIAQRKKIETKDRQIQVHAFKAKKREIGKLAKKEHLIRVKEIKRKAIKTKKLIKEATTDEEIEAMLNSINNDNNSRL